MRDRRAREALALAVVRDTFAAAASEIRIATEIRRAARHEFRPGLHASFAVRCIPSLRNLPERQ